MNLIELMTILVSMLNKNFALAFLDLETKLTGNAVVDSPERIDFDAIQKWTELGIGLTQVTTSHGSESLIEAIKLLAGAVPYIGFILPTLVDMLHKPEDDVAEIKLQLIEMDNHLFAIENKIDALSQQINDVAILSYFKSQSQPIGFLQRYYRRYIQDSNDVTFNALLQSCTQMDILRYVFYVEEELGDSTVMLPLMETILDGLDLANFQRWMKMLTASISQSMLLHTVCMFTRYENGTDLQNTMEADKMYFQRISGLLLKVTQDGTKHILDNFFDYVKNHVVESFAKKHFQLPNKEFASGLFSDLQKKFYFRNWFVLSYDPVWTDENHWITSGDSHVFSWFRKHNRNLQITHTITVMSNELSEIYSNAVFQTPKKIRCDYIYDSIASKIGRHTFNSIAVIQSTELSDDSFSVASLKDGHFHVTLRANAIMSSNDKFYEVYIVPA